MATKYDDIELAMALDRTNLDTLNRDNFRVGGAGIVHYQFTNKYAYSARELKDIALVIEYVQSAYDRIIGRVSRTVQS